MITDNIIELWKAKRDGIKIVKRPKGTTGMWLDCPESIMDYDWLIMEYKIKTASDSSLFT